MDETTIKSRTIGTCITLIKNYGYISYNDLATEKSIFFHSSEIKRHKGITSNNTPRIGETVEFSIVSDEEGKLKAIHVTAPGGEPLETLPVYFERVLREWLLEKEIMFRDEKKARSKAKWDVHKQITAGNGEIKAGATKAERVSHNTTSAPDIFFLDEVYVNGVRVIWLDAKSFPIASMGQLYDKIRRQITNWKRNISKHGAFMTIGGGSDAFVNESLILDWNLKHLVTIDLENVDSLNELQDIPEYIKPFLGEKIPRRVHISWPVTSLFPSTLEQPLYNLVNDPSQESRDVLWKITNKGFEWFNFAKNFINEHPLFAPNDKRVSSDALQIVKSISGQFSDVYRKGKCLKYLMKWNQLNLWLKSKCLQSEGEHFVSHMIRAMVENSPSIGSIPGIQDAILALCGIEEVPDTDTVMYQVSCKIQKILDQYSSSSAPEHIISDFLQIKELLKINIFHGELEDSLVEVLLSTFYKTLKFHLQSIIDFSKEWKQLVHNLAVKGTDAVDTCSIIESILRPLITVDIPEDHTSILYLSQMTQLTESSLDGLALQIANLSEMSKLSKRDIFLRFFICQNMLKLGVNLTLTKNGKLNNGHKINIKLPICFSTEDIHQFMCLVRELLENPSDDTGVAKKGQGKKTKKQQNKSNDKSGLSKTIIMKLLEKVSISTELFSFDENDSDDEAVERKEKGSHAKDRVGSDSKVAGKKPKAKIEQSTDKLVSA